ncbi:MAG: hypothetical protein M9927_10510 [Anaerolineae bacterium]|nr:hypothetical protein [Anaerolineae bacterium]
MLPALMALQSHGSVENIRENHASKSVSAPSARVGLSSLFQGKFTSPGEKSVFQIPIRNTGDLGADTFDLVSSPWPARFAPQTA